MSQATEFTDDDEVAAAELALGLIDGDRQLASQARLSTDPAFAAAYRRWENWAERMFVSADYAPRPALWSQIVGRLPANDALPVAGRAWPWQFATAASVVAAAVFGWIALNPAPVAAPAPAVVAAASTSPLVAVLTGSGNGVVTIALRDGDEQVISAPAGLNIGAHAAELWVIADGDKPRSLGVIRVSDAESHHLPTGTAQTIRPGATLAVSVEPMGGSPTGQPTGAVILTGKLKIV